MAKIQAKVEVEDTGATNVVDSDDNEEQQEVVLVTGTIGSGKTFLAASGSSFWPEELPAKEMVELKDMFWIQFDARATAGFRHNNIRVRVFDVNRYMSREDLWQRDYKRKPTIVQAIQTALREADKFCQAYGKGAKIVVDTISKMDYKLLLHHMEIAETEATTTGKALNTFRKFDLNLSAHNRIHEFLRATGASHIIYCCHLKALSPDVDKAQATKIVIGNAMWGPDLTGQAPKFYKSDESLQLVLKTTKAAKGGIVRKVIVGINETGYESKNRYEGLIPDETDANLGRMFAAISTGEWV